MSWICPTCKRSYAKKNQSHSCAVKSQEEHLKGKDENVIKTFRALLKFTKSLGKNVKVRYVKNAVLASSRSTFLSIKFTRSFLKIEFFSEQSIDEFPVEKNFQYTKKKNVCFVSLDRPSDLTSVLKKWIRKSFEMAS